MKERKILERGENAHLLATLFILGVIAAKTIRLLRNHDIFHLKLIR